MIKDKINEKEKMEFINSSIDYIKKKEKCLKTKIHKISKIFLKLNISQKKKLKKNLFLNNWKLESVENTNKIIFYNYKKILNLKFDSEYCSMKFSINLILSDKYFSYFSPFFLKKNNKEIITNNLIQNMKLCNFPKSLDILKKKFTNETLSKINYLKNPKKEEIYKFLDSTKFFKDVIKKNKDEKIRKIKFSNFFLNLNFKILKTNFIFDEKKKIKLSCLKFWKKYHSIKLNADFFIIKLENPLYHLIIIDNSFKNEFTFFWKFLKNIYTKNKNINIYTKSNYLWIPNFKKKLTDLKWFADKQSLYQFNLDFDNYILKNNFFDNEVNDFFITNEFVFGIIELNFNDENILPIFFSVIKKEEFIKKEIKKN